MITIKDAEEILKKEYHEDNFIYLLDDVLLPDFKKDEHKVVFNNGIFESVIQLGESKLCDITIYEVILKPGVEKRRVTITQEMFRILRGQGINNAVVAFANADKRNYRISLLTSKYEFDGDKVVKVISNPRRYSYSLGFGTKTKTAYQFLIAKGKVKNIDELTSRFSVEVVNKQFYSEIALAFTKLIGGQRDGKTYEKELSLHGVIDQNKYAEFAVRLIGRLVFCWFLKEKKSGNGVPLIPEDMLSLKAVSQTKNYYHDILEPLFFELLNTSQNRRKGKFLGSDYYNQIPYLNGGLFSPHTDDKYKYSPATETGQYGVVTIPNSWFDNFFGILSQYNFTVDENTSYDIELSIDPEMLGRIFENLLAEINPETGENAKKSTGSFYTPRDIVDYMVDNSILEYLKTKTEIDETRLKALISYSKEDDELANFDTKEKKSIINALYTVTVLDPACGSGAFPIGMLQKIVYMLQEIDPEANLWFDKATENVSILMKREFEKKFNSGSLDYIRKLSVIQNSIFGVDIQPIAVEIARLRCFLSLVIEEKVEDNEFNRGINPLPNLDFKFIIANSLISLPQDSDNSKIVKDNQISMFERQDHIDDLKAVREEYFSANDSETKIQLKFEFSEIQKAMFQTALENQKMASNRYQALFQWQPFSNETTPWFDPEWMFGIKDGFDIVLGNPPYGVKFDKISKEFLKNRFPNVPDLESADYFIELGIELIKNRGILSYIVPNMFLSNQFAKKFREELLKRLEYISIDNLSGWNVFEAAVVRNAIVFFSKKEINKSMFSLLDFVGQTIIKTKTLETDKILLKENIDNWLNLLMVDEEVRTIVKKMKCNAIELSKISNISQGLIPYDKYRGHTQEIIKNRIWNAKYQKDATFKKELQGKDIDRYSLNWNGEDWLSYGKWLAAPRRKEFFTELRILIREITNPRILATITDEEYYNTPSIINCIDFKISPYYLLGLLNSKLFSFYHIKTSPKANKGLFPKILVSDIKRLPINYNDEYAEELIDLVKKQLTHIKPENDLQIDNIVYKIYTLTDEEIATVEQSVK